MSSTRTALEKVTANIDESMGVRQAETHPQLTPVASPKDVGRTPLRDFGRLKLSRIVADPNQPRKEFDEESLQRLATSIRSTGQIQPIGVCWSDDLERWVVVAGERRFRAAQLAELDSIECYFEDDDLSESERRVKQLVENLLRSDLKPLEEANGYNALMELHGWNGKEVAEVVGVSPSRVSRALALLDLPEGIQAQVESGNLARSSAYEISKLDNSDVQQGLADRVASGELNQRKAAKSVRQRRGKKARASNRAHLTFDCSHGIQITVNVDRSLNYHHVQEAANDFLGEVELRIRGNIQI